MHQTDSCPCGSGHAFARCCQPIIQGQPAPSAEALMRSRYSAYVLGYWDYLHESWHPDTRPHSVSPTATQWLGLTIVHASESTVAFIARFKEGSANMALHETSRFKRLGNHWRYLDGVCDVRQE